MKDLPVALHDCSENIGIGDFRKVEALSHIVRLRNSFDSRVSRKRKQSRILTEFPNKQAATSGKALSSTFLLQTKPRPQLCNYVCPMSINIKILDNFVDAPSEPTLSGEISRQICDWKKTERDVREEVTSE